MLGSKFIGPSRENINVIEIKMNSIYFLEDEKDRLTIVPHLQNLELANPRLIGTYHFYSYSSFL